jgi:hypothetical protein
MADQDDAAKQAMIAENQAQVAAQAEAVRELKKNMQASKDEIDEAIAKLVELKEIFAPIQAAAKEQAAADAAEQKRKNLEKKEAEKLAAREKKKAAKAAASGSADGAAP